MACVPRNKPENKVMFGFDRNIIYMKFIVNFNTFIVVRGTEGRGGEMGEKYNAFFLAKKDVLMDCNHYIISG
jgi:hypothetical protein